MNLQIGGTISREDGTPVYKLEGRWNEYLDAGEGCCSMLFLLRLHAVLAAAAVETREGRGQNRYGCCEG